MNNETEEKFWKQQESDSKLLYENNAWIITAKDKFDMYTNLLAERLLNMDEFKKLVELNTINKDIKV